MSLTAVVFDMDGVLVDSESLWNDARRQLAERNGGRWSGDAQAAMMGMSSSEWSSYLHDELGVELSPPEISSRVAARMEDLYRERLPVLPGAREAVTALSREWPLALASSANRRIIELALELLGVADRFAAIVSSEEVPRGKPAPDVYLEAARRIGVQPPACAAVEDSASGIRSADAAGMTVVAVPNRDFPPGDEALTLAAATLDSLHQLSPDLIRRLGGPGGS